MPRVLIVDDDLEIREALTWLLESRRVSCESFASGEEMMAFIASEQAATGCDDDSWPLSPTCLLLDVRMPGSSGLACFDKICGRRLHQRMPVMFLSGHADVGSAVEVMRRGAFDFVEKPFSDNALVDRIDVALRASAAELMQLNVHQTVRERLSALTDREREVTELVVKGLSNKEIGAALSISVRTVEVHRSRSFEKLRVGSAVELAVYVRKSGLASDCLLAA